MRVAKVWIEHPVLQLDQVYSYDALQLPAEKGKRVIVDFNGRQIVGFVDEVAEVEDPAKTLAKGRPLKPILSVLDENALITPELFDLAKWMAKDTLSPVISCFQAMLPSKLKPKSSNQKIKMEQIAVYVADHPHLTPRQKEVLDWLKQQGPTGLSLWRKQSPAITRTLEKLGCVRLDSRAVKASAPQAAQAEAFLPLNADQQRVVHEIETSAKAVMLLHGVTGSGKTEVYLHLARQVLNQGKQVLILVPEISLTPQMVARVKGRFPTEVAIYHSALNNQQKYEQYCRVFEKQASIVVGTRSAVFMPFDHLGLIILDEEHDSSYKQDSLPQYHCRDIAIHRAQYFGCKVILGSATPSLESYARALKGVYGLTELKERVNRQLPVCTVVDMKNQSRSQSGILSDELKQKIAERLDRKEQVILLLNRRGYSPLIKCGQCGETLQCPHCDVALSYHKSINKMKCHLCGSEYPLITVCPKCGSRTFAAPGYGTQKLEEEVARLFPQARILRMDADTTSRKQAHQTLLEQFGRHEADILVGTQMIAKGLDYPQVTLVGILNADAGTARPDFRSVEMTFDLIMQAAGRSGRSSTPGEVIIQAFDPNHFAVAAGSRQDYSGFFYQEMQYRHLGGYPPYTYLIALTFSDSHPERPKQSAQWFAQALRQTNAFKVLGPSDLFKLQDRYRSRLVLKGKNLDQMKAVLSKILEEYRTQRTQAHLSIDVNPLILD
ncbi:replication restart helicase PriA [Holdemania massiliensis]|uniref:replication restart helicase PriA n=1 Tax=Holdemania massiliensis TaxID=1468449 RepID=UPI001F051D81|nr:primosomal protein N' [Holdemania massiliensis]MCH1941222.1 primosomal protein N' [Holdemania massiliensis]